MTPSEKPERPDSRTDEDANRTSVITTDDGATPATAEGGAEDTSTSADGGGESPDGVQAPPPWDRATTAPPEDGAAEKSAKTGKSGKSAAAGSAAAGSAAGSAAAGSAEEDEDTGDQGRTRQAEEPDTLRMVAPKAAGAQTAGAAGTTGRTSSYGGARSGAATAASSSSRRPSRGPRRASLQVKRVDPWSVLKLALVLSVALFFVWMIAVAVLYGVLDGMGVWDQLNGTFTELTQSSNTANEALISAGKVFSVASVIGGINIVLFTALATVAAFIYNVAADFAGGIELTLSERE